MGGEEVLCVAAASGSDVIYFGRRCAREESVRRGSGGCGRGMDHCDDREEERILRMEGSRVEEQGRGCL